MREEKGKAPLVLMEQAIMILAFALAAAICIQAFSKANLMSIQSEQLDRAVSLSQTGAELIKANKGDLGATQEELEGQGMKVELNQDSLQVTDKNGLTMIITLTDSQDLLGGAKVQIESDQSCIYELEVCWQQEVTDED